MLHCEKGHENPEGALFCKECGLKLENKNQPEIIYYKFSFLPLPLILKIAFYLFGISILFIILGLIASLFDVSETSENLVIVGVDSMMISFIMTIILSLKHGYKRKCFSLPLTINDAKETFMQFTLSENRKNENGERYRIKLKNENSLFIYDSTYKARFYVSMDKNLRTIILGQRDPSIELIRKVLGSQLDFIETKNL